MTKKNHWCDCPNGSQTVIAPKAPQRVDAFGVGRDHRNDMKNLEVGDEIVEEGKLALEHLSRMTYTFWKPIELPIDLLVNVETR